MKKNVLLHGVVPFAVRVLFAIVFAANAVGLGSTFADVVRLMSTKGLPWPEALLAITIAAWVGGAACLLIGFRIRWAAGVLASVMVPVTVGIHGPWLASPAAFQNELVQFLKNIGFIAGLLSMLASPPGLFAFDRYFDANCSKNRVRNH